MPGVSNMPAPVFMRSGSLDEIPPTRSLAIYAVSKFSYIDDLLYMQSSVGSQNRSPEPGRGINPQGVGYGEITNIYTPIDSMWEVDVVMPISIAAARIFGFTDASGNYYLLNTAVGNFLLLGRGSEYATIPISSFKVIGGAKYNIRIKFNGAATDPDVFVNGFQISYVGAWTPEGTVTASTRSIGAAPGGGAEFTGLISNVKIWNAAGELLDLYNLEEAGGDIAHSSVEEWSIDKIDQDNWFTPAYWDNTFNANWSQVGETLVSNGADGYCIKNGFWTIGRTYRITVTTIVNSGGLLVYGTGGAAQSTVSGTIVYYYTPSDTKLYLRSLLFDGTITGLSIEEVYGENHMPIINRPVDFWTTDPRFASSQNSKGFTEAFETAALTEAYKEIYSLIQEYSIDRVTADDAAHIYSSTNSSATGNGYVIKWDSDGYIRLYRKDAGVLTVLGVSANAYLGNYVAFTSTYTQINGRFRIDIVDNGNAEWFQAFDTTYNPSSFANTYIIGRSQILTTITLILDGIVQDFQDFVVTIGGLEEIHVPAQIDKDGVVTGMDVHEGDLQYPGKVAQNLRIDSPAGVFNGVDDEVIFTDAVIVPLIVSLEIRYLDGTWITITDTILGGTTVTGLWRVNGNDLELGYDGTNWFTGNIASVIGYNSTGIEIFKASITGLSELEYDVVASILGTWAGTGSRTTNSPYGTGWNIQKGFTENLLSSGVAAGIVLQEDAYGIFAFTLQKKSAASQLYFAFILSEQLSAASNGYVLQISSTGVVTLWRFDAGAPTSLFATAAAYATLGERYEFIIYRNESLDQYVTGAKGTFAVFIKGGVYADWTLVSSLITDDTHKISLYLNAYRSAGSPADEYRNIVINGRYISPMEFAIGAGITLGEIPALADGSADVTGGAITNPWITKGSNLAAGYINKNPFDAPEVNYLEEFIVCNVARSINAEVPGGTVIGDITFEDGGTGVAVPVLVGTTLTFALTVGQVIAQVYAGDVYIPLIEFWTSSQYDDGTDHTADVTIAYVSLKVDYIAGDVLSLPYGWDLNNWTDINITSKTRNEINTSAAGGVKLATIINKVGLWFFKFKGITDISFDITNFDGTVVYKTVALGGFDFEGIIYVSTTDGGYIRLSGAGSATFEDLYFEHLLPSLEFERKWFTGLEEELGPESVVDGGFDDPSKWVASGSWVVANSKASAINETSNISQINVLTVGKIYRITYEIVDYVSGTVRIRAGSNYGAINSGNGVHTETIICTGNGVLIIDGQTSFTGAIYNISAKEILFGEYGNRTVLRKEEEYTLYGAVTPSSKADIEDYFKNMLLPPISVDHNPDIPGNIYIDYFLPSRSTLVEMYNNLKAFGVGNFTDSFYWSSYENSATAAWTANMGAGGISGVSKNNNTLSVRACRSFVAAIGAYALRDVGPAGGLIFYIDGAGTTYFEAAPSDQSIARDWSNINNSYIGTTLSSIGSGQQNTLDIIAQVGHVDSAAKLCADLVIIN